jgi:F0F1-type ATP synthase membrane subunit b/b'
MNKPAKQTKQEIQQRAKEIKVIYEKYLQKLNVLRDKQMKIINQFVKELEQKKIEEIEKP